MRFPLITAFLYDSSSQGKTHQYFVPVVRDVLFPVVEAKTGAEGLHSHRTLHRAITGCFRPSLTSKKRVSLGSVPDLGRPAASFCANPTGSLCPAECASVGTRESIVSACLFAPHIPHIKSIKAGLVCDHCGTPRTRRTDKEKLSLG
jgi:hypothetical protein